MLPPERSHSSNWQYQSFFLVLSGSTQGSGPHLLPWPQSAQLGHCAVHSSSVHCAAFCVASAPVYGGTHRHDQLAPATTHCCPDAAHVSELVPLWLAAFASHAPPNKHDGTIAPFVPVVLLPGHRHSQSPVELIDGSGSEHVCPASAHVSHAVAPSHSLKSQPPCPEAAPVAMTAFHCGCTHAQYQSFEFVGAVAWFGSSHVFWNIAQVLSFVVQSPSHWHVAVPAICFPVEDPVHSQYQSPAAA